MKIYKILTIILILGSLLTILLVSSPTKLGLKEENNKPITFSKTNKYKTAEMIIGEIKIPVELALTPEEQSLGLGKRDSLPANSGMLFDLRDKKNTIPTFWMKDMHFDLDMIWIKNDRVAYIHENVPAPKDEQSELPIYSPTEPVDYVFEVNAGFVQKNKIAIGDSVSIENQ